MKVSPFCKRFKRTHFTGDTFTLPDMRSSIIRTIEGYHRYPNTDDLKRLEKEPQNIEIDTPKTDRILFNVDRAILALSYADTVIISGHTVRPDVSRPSVSTSHGLILNHPYNHIHIYLITSHGQADTKPKTYPIIEMIPFLVYYSYERKYHNGTSMFISGYQCLNIYINVEKGTLINKDIQ